MAPFVKGILDRRTAGTYLAAELWARLAQSVEQLTFNQWVAGSIPAARTSFRPFQAKKSRNCRDDIAVVTGFYFHQSVGCTLQATIVALGICFLAG
tara:strand:+ start:333 stop:620 length:288 start_codon:yes stop_codon:yes gene_type:complete